MSHPIAKALALILMVLTVLNAASHQDRVDRLAASNVDALIQLSATRSEADTLRARLAVEQATKARLDKALRAKAKRTRADLRALIAEQELEAQKATPKGYARWLLAERGQLGQWGCLEQLWEEESGWEITADNPSSSAYGIPQSLPGSKMGPGWRTDYRVQIRWGLRYIAGRYSTPCNALSAKHRKGWY